MIFWQEYFVYHFPITRTLVWLVISALKREKLTLLCPRSHGWEAAKLRLQSCSAYKGWAPKHCTECFFPVTPLGCCLFIILSIHLPQQLPVCVIFYFVFIYLYYFIYSFICHLRHSYRYSILFTFLYCYIILSLHSFLSFKVCQLNGIKIYPEI